MGPSERTATTDLGGPTALEFHTAQFVIRSTPPTDTTMMSRAAKVHVRSDASVANHMAMTAGRVRQMGASLCPGTRSPISSMATPPRVTTPQAIEAPQKSAARAPVPATSRRRFHTTTQASPAARTDGIR